MDDDDDDDATTAVWTEWYDADWSSLSPREAAQKIVGPHASKLTEEELRLFITAIDAAITGYGSWVGAVAAESMGEGS